MGLTPTRMPTTSRDQFRRVSCNTKITPKSTHLLVFFSYRLIHKLKNILKDFARIEYITKRIMTTQFKQRQQTTQFKIRQQIMRKVFDGVLPTAKQGVKFNISDTDVRALEQFVPIYNEYFRSEIEDLEYNYVVLEYNYTSLKVETRKLTIDLNGKIDDLEYKYKKLEEENEKLKEDIERLA